MAQRQVLGVGIIGAGYMGDVHVRSWQGVRDADIVAVASRSLQSAAKLARRAEDCGVGADVAAYDDVAALVQDPRVDAVWLLTPNDVRLDAVRDVHAECASGRASLSAIAIEKPLGRTVAEARAVLELVEDAGLLHAYLENQIYSPSLTVAHERIWSDGAAASGSPFLARCTGEHGGPHSAWFWNGPVQGGGVLTDMMCHAVETGRFLLTPPGRNSSDWLRPVSVSATTASLKWGRRHYAEALRQAHPGVLDYSRQPSEDYAQASFVFENGDGEPVVVEATTSWNYTGAGLHQSFELLGPEYSMTSHPFGHEASIYLSPGLPPASSAGAAGAETDENHPAGRGLIPLVSDDGVSYGYTAENALFSRQFLRGEQPLESLSKGLEVVELMMAAYSAAQSGQTVTWPLALGDFVPQVAQGTWNPRTAFDT